VSVVLCPVYLVVVPEMLIAGIVLAVNVVVIILSQPLLAGNVSLYVPLVFAIVPLGKV